MMETPEALRYTQDHEWVTEPTNGLVRVGITDFAQDALGDVVYVELPTVGTHYEAGAALAEVESTKSVSEIFAPLGGEVTGVNDQLNGAPELVNTSPYGDGWFFELALDDATQWGELLDAVAYRTLTE